MTASGRQLDSIYVAASRWDGRFTRICVASIRHFYPEAPIKLLAGGCLEAGLAEELTRYWGVVLADFPKRDWGWGFVKLEPLFGPPGERFLVLDSDTALAGPVLDVWAGGSADFMVDCEKQMHEEVQRLYYDWPRLAEVDSAAAAPAFVFNSGQWFGTAGVLKREDFSRYLDWNSAPAGLRQPELFKQGEQGLLNYVLNQKVATEGLAVDRRKIMRWPGHGMDGLDVNSMSSCSGPPLVIHWAGMKKSTLGAMEGGEILRYFEGLYYSRMPSGSLRQTGAALRYPVSSWGHEIRERVRLRLRMMLATGIVDERA